MTSATVVGALDDVERGNRVAGWARIPGGGAAVEVEIVVDGMAIATVTADQYRDDLTANGWGDCAFWCDLPPHLLDGAEHLVGANFAATALPLQNAPRAFALFPDKPEGGFRGALDGIEQGGWAAGWACVADDGTPQTIDIWIDDALVGHASADRFRDDLARSGSGDCAFRFGIPPILLDGRDHAIDARYGGTDRSLPGSPQSFRILAADPLLTDGANRIPTAAFDFWPNGLRVAPRAQFEEIVSGWYLDFPRERPPTVTIEADRPRDIGLSDQDYAMRITVSQDDGDAEIRLVVPIAVGLHELEQYRFSIGLHRPVAANDDALHVADIHVAALTGLSPKRIAALHGPLRPRGTIHADGMPAMDRQALTADNPCDTLALVIALHGHGVLTLFSPTLTPAR